MKYYLMIVLAVILLAGDFAVNKLYQKRYGTSLETGLKFNALMGLFTAIIFFAINGFKFEFSAFSVLMAGIVALSIMSYNILGFRVLKSGSMAFYTLFLMCGGMFVPYVWGVLFLHEKLSLMHLAGLILIISAIALTANDKKMPGKRILALCVIIFFLNGISSVAAKMHQIEKTYFCITETEFVIATGIAKFIIAAIAYMIVKIGKKDKNADKCNKSGFAWGVLLIVLSTLLSGLSYILQLNGAKNLPATVLYPLITGGTIIFSSLTGIIFFKEQISKKLILSIIICFAGTCMFLQQ